MLEKVLGLGAVRDGGVGGRPRFFAFVLAPVAFHRLASADEAGLVVGGTLEILHGSALSAVCFSTLLQVFCGCETEVPACVAFAIEMALAGVMLAGNGYSEFRILPAMEQEWGCRPVE